MRFGQVHPQRERPDPFFRRETRFATQVGDLLSDQSAPFTLFRGLQVMLRKCTRPRVHIVFDQVLASVYPLTSHHLTLHPRITLRAPLVARLPTTKLHRGIYHLCSHLGPPSRKPRRC